MLWHWLSFILRWHDRCKACAVDLHHWLILSFLLTVSYKWIFFWFWFGLGINHKYLLLRFIFPCNWCCGFECIYLTFSLITCQFACWLKRKTCISRLHITSQFACFIEKEKVHAEFVWSLDFHGLHNRPAWSLTLHGIWNLHVTSLVHDNVLWFKIIRNLSIYLSYLSLRIMYSCQENGVSKPLSFPNKLSWKVPALNVLFLCVFILYWQWSAHCKSWPCGVLVLHALSCNFNLFTSRFCCLAWYSLD